MDVKDLRIEKQKLEIKIQAAVVNLVDEFQQVTEVTPSAIDIDMYNVTSIGSKFREFAVGQVKASISLD